MTKFNWDRVIYDEAGYLLSLPAERNPRFRRIYIEVVGDNNSHQLLTENRWARMWIQHKRSGWFSL